MRRCVCSKRVTRRRCTCRRPRFAWTSCDRAPHARRCASSRASPGTSTRSLTAGFRGRSPGLIRIRRLRTRRCAITWRSTRAGSTPPGWGTNWSRRSRATSMAAGSSEISSGLSREPPGRSRGSPRTSGDGGSGPGLTRARRRSDAAPNRHAMGQVAHTLCPGMVKAEAGARKALPRWYVDAVPLPDLAQDASRHPGRDDARWEILGEDGSGSHHGVLTDRHTRANDNAAPEPDVVFDGDRLGILPADPARLGVDRMGGGEKLDPRGDLAGGADGDRRDVEHDRVDVDERPVADADVAVLAVERRAHDDALADVAQHPPQQPVPLVPRTGRGAVE